MTASTDRERAAAELASGEAMFRYEEHRLFGERRYADVAERLLTRVRVQFWVALALSFLLAATAAYHFVAYGTDARISTLILAVGLLIASLGLAIFWTQKSEHARGHITRAMEWLDEEPSLEDVE